MPRTVDELAREAMPLLPIVARKLQPPPGLSFEDLESAGNEAIFEAATRYDESTGTPWKGFAYRGIKQAMRNAISTHRRHPTVTITPTVGDKGLAPPADPRASDPAELAAVRESVRRHPVADTLPSPEVVADQVTRLRVAMFGAVSEADVAAIMGSVIDKAKGGDLRAAKLVTDLLAPSRSGVTVNQQVVAIRATDIG